MAALVRPGAGTLAALGRIGRGPMTAMGRRAVMGGVMGTRRVVVGIVVQVIGPGVIMARVLAIAPGPTSGTRGA